MTVLDLKVGYSNHATLWSDEGTEEMKKLKTVIWSVALHCDVTWTIQLELKIQPTRIKSLKIRMWRKESTGRRR